MIHGALHEPETLLTFDAVCDHENFDEGFQQMNVSQRRILLQSLDRQVSMLAPGKHFNRLSKLLSVAPHVFLSSFRSVSKSTLDSIVTHCDSHTELTVASWTCEILAQHVLYARGRQIQFLRLLDGWMGSLFPSVFKTCTQLQRLVLARVGPRNITGFSHILSHVGRTLLDLTLWESYFENHDLEMIRNRCPLLESLMIVPCGLLGIPAQYFHLLGS